MPPRRWKATPTPAASETQPEEGLAYITAPLAGVFYGAASPDEPPYVSEGEAVEAGQVVALVEAMKVFNEIHADVSGVVVAVLASNGQTVLAGQTLITIRPDEAGASQPDLAEPRGTGLSRRSVARRRAVRPASARRWPPR